MKCDGVIDIWLIEGGTISGIAHGIEDWQDGDFVIFRKVKTPPPYFKSRIIQVEDKFFRLDDPVHKEEEIV